MATVFGHSIAVLMGGGDQRGAGWGRSYAKQRVGGGALCGALWRARLRAPQAAHIRDDFVLAQ